MKNFGLKIDLAADKLAYYGHLVSTACSGYRKTRAYQDFLAGLERDFPGAGTIFDRVMEQVFISRIAHVLSNFFGHPGYKEVVRLFLNDDEFKQELERRLQRLRVLLALGESLAVARILGESDLDDDDTLFEKTLKVFLVSHSLHLRDPEFKASFLAKIGQEFGDDVAQELRAYDELYPELPRHIDQMPEHILNALASDYTANLMKVMSHLEGF